LYLQFIAGDRLIIQRYGYSTVEFFVSRLDDVDEVQDVDRLKKEVQT